MPFKYLSNLPPRIPVEVHFTLISGRPLKKNGTAVVVDAETIAISFPAGKIPDFEQIDDESDCLVFIENEEIVTLVCTLLKLPSEPALHFRVHDLIRHGEKRGFFRGSAERIAISCSRKAYKSEGSFAVKGINISCGGILMKANHRLKKKERLVVELEMPEPVEKTHTCQAFVLRIQKLEENEFLTAVRFIELESEICDDIMAFCFAEERRRIREYVAPRDI